MKVPVHNNTAIPIYVGATMIPPGETYHFNEEQVPQHLRPEPIAEELVEAVDPLLELLKGNVGMVVDALAELSMVEVERLGELEQRGRARKGILSKIAELELAYASQTEMRDKVVLLTDENLAAELAVEGLQQSNAEWFAILQAEQVKRQEAK